MRSLALVEAEFAGHEVVGHAKLGVLAKVGVGATATIGIATSTLGTGITTLAVEVLETSSITVHVRRLGTRLGTALIGTSSSLRVDSNVGVLRITVTSTGILIPGELLAITLGAGEMLAAVDLLAIRSGILGTTTSTATLCGLALTSILVGNVGASGASGLCGKRSCATVAGLVASTLSGGLLSNRTLGSLSRGSLLTGGGTGTVSTTSSTVTSTTCGTAATTASWRGERGVENSSGNVVDGHPLLLAVGSSDGALVSSLRLVGLFLCLLLLLA